MSIDVVSAFLEVELDERTVIYMWDLVRELVVINGTYGPFMNYKGQIVVGAGAYGR